MAAGDEIVSNMEVGEFTMLEHRTVGVLYFLSGILGIGSNLILVLVFLRDHPLTGSRHRLHLQFIIANIMVVAGTPFSGSSAFAGRWLWGDLGCQLYGLETYAGGMGVVTFGFLLCVQRFFSTSCPEHSIGSSSNTLCLLGWLFSVTVSVMPLFGWNKFEIESSGTACGLNYLSDNSSFTSYFLLLNVSMSLMMVLGLLALRGAFTSTPKTDTKTDDWFSESQLNWIAAINFAIAIIGFSPYGYMSVWALMGTKSRMTMIASAIPPVAAKLSTIFYPVAYCAASSKFWDAFYGRVFGANVSKKDN